AVRSTGAVVLSARTIKGTASNTITMGRASFRNIGHALLKVSCPQAWTWLVQLPIRQRETCQSLCLRGLRVAPYGWSFEIPSNIPARSRALRLDGAFRPSPSPALPAL